MKLQIPERGERKERHPIKRNDHSQHHHSTSETSTFSELTHIPPQVKWKPKSVPWWERLKAPIICESPHNRRDHIQVFRLKYIFSIRFKKASCSIHLTHKSLLLTTFKTYWRWNHFKWMPLGLQMSQDILCMKWTILCKDLLESSACTMTFAPKVNQKTAWCQLNQLNTGSKQQWPHLQHQKMWDNCPKITFYDTTNTEWEFLAIFYVSTSTHTSTDAPSLQRQTTSSWRWSQTTNCWQEYLKKILPSHHTGFKEYYYRYTRTLYNQDHKYL